MGPYAHNYTKLGILSQGDQDASLCGLALRLTQDIVHTNFYAGKTGKRYSLSSSGHPYGLISAHYRIPEDLDYIIL